MVNHHWVTLRGDNMNTKTNFNNFDQSSTGHNIEFSLFYETENHFFDDDFTDLSGDLWLFINGHLKTEMIDKIKIELSGDQSIEQQKRTILNLIESEHYDGTIPLDDVKDILYNMKWYIDNDNYSLVDFYKDEYLTNDYDMTEKRMYEYFLESDHFEVNYNIVSIRGHSQGDYAEVLYIIEPDNTPMTADENETAEYFRQQFYDSPVYGCANINGEEYFLHEYLHDIYDWDKDGFINNFSEHHKDNIPPEALNQFFEMLPDTLDYIS